jgi:hypothetical protein
MAGAPFVTRLVFCDGQVRHRRTAQPIAEPSIASQTQEKWMKLVKASAIAFAMSAMLAGPVLAQGASSDTQIRGGAHGKTNMQGGGMSGTDDEDVNTQPAAPGAKAGVNAKAGAKGTVGSATGSPKGTSSTTGDPATGGKRY